MSDFFALFSVGTWLFWLLTVIAIVASTIITEVNNGRAIMAVGTVVYFLIFGNSFLKLLTSTLTVTAIIYLVVGYVAVGMIWTLIKWALHVQRVKQQIRETTNLSSSTKATFKEALAPSQNKGRIIAWGVYWPVSMLWSAVHEPAEALFLAMLNWYNSIAEGANMELEEKFTSSTKNDSYHR